MRALLIVAAIAVTLAAASLHSPRRHIGAHKRVGAPAEDAARITREFIESIAFKNFSRAAELINPDAFVFVSPWGCQTLNGTGFLAQVEQSMSYIDELRIDFNELPIVSDNTAYFITEVAGVLKHQGKAGYLASSPLFPLRETPGEMGYIYAPKAAFVGHVKNGKLEAFEEFLSTSQTSSNTTLNMLTKLKDAFVARDINAFSALLANETTFQFWSIEDGRAPMNATRSELIANVNYTMSAGKVWAEADWKFDTCGIVVGHTTSFAATKDYKISIGVISLTLSQDQSVINEYTVLRHGDQRRH